MAILLAMRFGAKLKEQARPEWRSEYIDYDLLKKKIAELVSLSEDPKAEEVFKTKRRVFQSLLDTYIERVSRSVERTIDCQVIVKVFEKSPYRFLSSYPFSQTNICTRWVIQYA